MKLLLAAFVVPFTSTCAQAALILSAGVPTGAVNIAGGPVSIDIPLYIGQSSPTTVISTVGLYSVGASVARTAGVADITGATRFASNFDDAALSTVTFIPTSALLTVQRNAIDGVSDASGQLQFGTLTLLLSDAGTTTFSLADNDLSPSVTDTLSGDLDALDHLLTNSSFSITAVVPEPTTIGVASVFAASLLLRRRR